MCMMCDGASRDESLFSIHHAIQTYGWSLQAVESSGPRDKPWVYSIGLVAAFGHPELVVVNVDALASARALNQIGELVRAGRRFESGDQVQVSGLTFTFGRVDRAHVDRGLMAMWTEYYEKVGGPMPPLEALQVIFPGESFCECHQGSTPRLSNPAARLSGGRPRGGPPGRKPKRRRR